MTRRRKHSRVDVNLPVSCRFNSEKIQKNIYSIGSVSDLSVGGMRISLPLSDDSLQAKSIQYHLKLPAPFNQFSGAGEVKWRAQDDENQRLLFGLSFSTLSEEQQKDLESIITELQEDTTEN